MAHVLAHPATPFPLHPDPHSSSYPPQVRTRLLEHLCSRDYTKEDTEAQHLLLLYDEILTWQRDARRAEPASIVAAFAPLVLSTYDDDEQAPVLTGTGVGASTSRSLSDEVAELLLNAT
jgi:hypothetical protein